MRFLRMFLNSLLAGALFAWYLTALFLQLNPTLPRSAGAVAPLALALLLSYGLLFALACYAALVLRQILGGELTSLGWISLRVFGWLSLAASTVAGTLMWLNLRGLRVSIDAGAARRMAIGAAVLTVAAAVLLMLLLLRHSIGARAATAGSVLLGAVLSASVVIPFWVRGPGRSLPPLQPHAGPAFVTADTRARLFLVLLDGASLDFISPAAADGRLPNFGRMLDTGAAMHLATLRPTQPVPVWTSVATGKLPFRTGVRAAAAVRIEPNGPIVDLLPDYCFAHALVYSGFAADVPQTSAALRARPLWDVLGHSGVDSLIVRWPLTYPVRPMRGIMVSDRFHLPPHAALPDPGVTFPGDLFWTLRTALEQGPRGSALSAPPLVSTAIDLDRRYGAAFDAAAAISNARFSAIRYEGLDAVGHYYLRQAMPRVFGDVPGDEQRQFGHLLEQYYRYLDTEIGRMLDRLGPDDLLMVVSGFGMEPISLPKRAVDRVFGSGMMSGSHERAPDGFLLAYGAAVRPGHLSRASVVDVAPTVLYFFGLPIARDMDGYARTDLFSRGFTEEHPVTFIPSYE